MTEPRQWIALSQFVKLLDKFERAAQRNDALTMNIINTRLALVGYRLVMIEGQCWCEMLRK